MGDNPPKLPPAFPSTEGALKKLHVPDPIDGDILSYHDLAAAARQAREEGNEEAARQFIDTMHHDLRQQGEEAGDDGRAIQSEIDQYDKLLDDDADSDQSTETRAESSEERGEQNEPLDVGAIVTTSDGKRWAVAAAKQNARTGKMEYLVSDATTKEEGLSNQRFVTEDELRGTENSLDLGEGAAKDLGAHNESSPGMNGDQGGARSSDPEDYYDEVEELFGGTKIRDDFSEGRNVVVERSSGDIEDGWIVRSTDRDTVEVVKQSPKGMLVKRIPYHELAALNGEKNHAGAERPNPEGYENAAKLFGSGDAEKQPAAEADRPNPDGYDEVAKLFGNDQETPSSERLLKSYEKARHDYAIETAKTRDGMWGRFLETDNNFFSKWIKKIPGAKRLAELVNERFTKHEALDTARDTYAVALKEQLEKENEEIQRSIEAETATVKEGLKQKLDRGKITQEQYDGLMKNYAEIEASVDSLRAKKIEQLTNHNALLEQDILAAHDSNSKKSTRFTDWWARQDGVKWGKLKKAGVLVCAGVATGATIAVGGLVVGVAAPAFVATAASGGVGVAIGQRVNHRLANSRIDKNHSGLTIAEQRSKQNLASQRQNLDALFRGLSRDEEGRLSGADASGIQNIIAGTEQSTSETVKHNRNRTKSAMGAAALGGRLGVFGVDGIHSIVDTFSHDGSNPSGAEAHGTHVDSHSPDETMTPHDTTIGGGHEAANHDFGSVTVNTNDAPEHAIRQLLENAGHGKMNTSQIDQLTREGYARFGDHFMVDGSGNPVDLTNFKGNIGVAYQALDKTLVVRPGSPAVAQWLSSRVS